MISSPEIQKRSLDYSYLDTGFPTKCPVCIIQTLRKTKTFKTLRQLSWHFSREHAKEGNCSNKFTIKDIQETIKELVFAQQIGMIPTRKDHPSTPIYPVVKRLQMDDDRV